MPSDRWQEHRVVGHQTLVYKPQAVGDTAIVCLGHDLFEPFACAELIEEEAEQLRCPVVLLEARGTWWLHRQVEEFDAQLTPDAWVAEAVFDWLHERYRPAQVVLSGVGTGGQGALRIAFRHPRRFAGVAAVQPWIDFHQRYWEDELLQRVFPDVESARQLTATLWINPLNRPLAISLLANRDDATWFRGIERLHDKLVAIGVPHQWEVVSAPVEDLFGLARAKLAALLRSTVLALRSNELRPLPGGEAE